jgi:hypothetical protein
MHFATSLVRRGLPLLAGGALALVLAGCNEVKQSDYDALKAQLTAKEQALAAAQQKLTDLQKQLSTAAAPAGGTDDLVPILGARKSPPMDPLPLPDTLPIPVPAGVPASYEQPVGPYAMYVEHVAALTPSKYGLIASLGCVQQNVFKRGMKMVFRIEFYDMATGKRVTPQDQAIVKVKLGSGEEIPLSFSRRGGPSGPPDAPWQWVTAWHIPTDYPLGSVDYSVLLTAQNGETTTLKPPVLANFTQLRVID